MALPTLTQADIITLQRDANPNDPSWEACAPEYPGHGHSMPVTAVATGGESKDKVHRMKPLESGLQCRIRRQLVLRIGSANTTEPIEAGLQSKILGLGLRPRLLGLMDWASSTNLPCKPSTWRTLDQQWLSATVGYGSRSGNNVRFSGPGFQKTALTSTPGTCAPDSIDTIPHPCGLG